MSIRHRPEGRARPEYRETAARPYAGVMTDPDTGKTLAEFSFMAEHPVASRAALLAGRAEIATLDGADDLEDVSLKGGVSGEEGV